LSIFTSLVCCALFGGTKFKSIFLFMSGLEHYTFIVKRIFLLISILIFLIFAFSLPAGRNFILVSFLWQTIFWLIARKILSKWVRVEVSKLKVFIITSNFFVSEYFEKNFNTVEVGTAKCIEDLSFGSFDLILFHNFTRLDLDHFVLIAKLQQSGITSGYISNEIKLQGWSGIQVLVGPHLMMINSSYSNALFVLTWKRLFDLTCIALAFLFVLPLFFLLSIILYFLNGKPVFYSQERVGQNGKKFNIFKFRTIKLSSGIGHKALDGGSVWAKKPQPEELVLMGRWLRRWSIDELPQLLNVILGEMSLVGPRPRLVTETNEAYEIASPIFTMGLKPGITGLWQISGRNEIDPNFALALDKYYLDHWNPIFDFQIIIKTISAIRNGIGAK
jgi:lipopolysaccharide/colanic/teichoic acid biosynthesis glycosyltransferase